MPEIHGFIAKIVANPCAYCYNRTVVLVREFSRTLRVVRVSMFNSPDSLVITDTPTRH